MKDRHAEDAPASQGKEVEKRGAKEKKCKFEKQTESGAKEVADEGSLNRLLPSVGDAIFQPMSRDVANCRRES